MRFYRLDLDYEEIRILGRAMADSTERDKPKQKEKVRLVQRIADLMRAANTVEEERNKQKQGNLIPESKPQ